MSEHVKSKHGTAHKKNDELKKKAYDFGAHSVYWGHFVGEAGIDEQTARRIYYKDWQTGKNEAIYAESKERREMIKLMKECANQTKEWTEKASIRNSVAQRNEAFLSKRSPEWSTKQQIEQTNLNIEAPKTDLSKLSEDEKDKLKELLLKTQG